jgi:hypothetical protein
VFSIVVFGAANLAWPLIDNKSAMSCFLPNLGADSRCVDPYVTLSVSNFLGVNPFRVIGLQKSTEDSSV